MSLQKLPPAQTLTFAERHPIAKQIWDDTLKLSWEEAIVPGGMTIGTFIISYVRGEIVSVATGALWLLLSVLVGVVLYLLINIIRAPFIVIGRQQQQLADLNRRLTDVEARPPVITEGSFIAPIPTQPADEPNIVYVNPNHELESG